MNDREGGGIPLIEAKALVKRYEQSDDAVLRGASLSLNSGDCVALLGASGSGKSTFLHCMALLDKQDSGQIVFEGKSLLGLSSSQKASLRLHKMGFIFQFHHLVPELTLVENVGLPASLAGRKDPDFVAHLIERVGLKGKEARFPWQLSGGEQQRVALARSLVNRPKILFTDEATGNLDAARSREILELLFDMNREFGTTLLSVTHDEQLACRYQKQYRLEDGKIVETDLKGKR